MKRRDKQLWNFFNSLAVYLRQRKEEGKISTEDFTNWSKDLSTRLIINIKANTGAETFLSRKDIFINYFDNNFHNFALDDKCKETNFTVIPVYDIRNLSYEQAFSRLGSIKDSVLTQSQIISILADFHFQNGDSLVFLFEDKNRLFLARIEKIRKDFSATVSYYEEVKESVGSYIMFSQI
jgi:hypothetical protein